MFCAQAVTALMKLADCLLNCLNLLCLGSTFVFFFYLGAISAIEPPTKQALESISFLRA